MNINNGKSVNEETDETPNTLQTTSIPFLGFWLFFRSWGKTFWNLVKNVLGIRHHRDQ